ncbi:anthrone oxygenase family protein [Sinomonas mesophila]|uniref:anthrone oxygenase family protein n=1 Tax=Sinomonas mesophila TaxID=1531955 RepID=UPI00111573E6|nr:anthrone oxygenase family protein [Sinomonas mesophila]
MDLLGFIVLLLVGFAAFAEFGSYALVHPVVRRMPDAEQIRFEQGLLSTFGRVYPVLMPLGIALLIAYAIWGGGEGGSSLWRWLAAGAWALATATTLAVNVPINADTARWDPRQPPEGWRGVRRRWDAFQGVRAWLLLGAFGLLAIGFASG